MENLIKKNCVELTAAEGYVVTNYKEGDKSIRFSRVAHVDADSEGEYYAIKESDARIKQIQLREIMREKMMQSRKVE